ncbi:recombinase [Synechococcus phage S-CRES1]|nr:recombinase [Synechococcus phage S-CRES1]
MTLPNLAGVATKDLVEKIGSGKFSAAYINWSRTMNLLRQHAPGWLVDYVPAEDGSLLHRAPVGAYLLIRFQNMETGAVTPALPQAVMDHRNSAIAFDKITARDVTDTQRRGMCMAAAMHFGLAYELWAKMPMENGYQSEEAPAAPKAPTSAPSKAPSEPKVAAEAVKESEATFREAALEKGVHTVAIDTLVTIVGDKLGGDFEKGLGVLASKSAEELNAKYGPKSEEAEQW